MASFSLSYELFPSFITLHLPSCFWAPIYHLRLSIADHQLVALPARTGTLFDSILHVRDYSISCSISRSLATFPAYEYTRPHSLLALTEPADLSVLALPYLTVHIARDTPFPTSISSDSPYYLGHIADIPYPFHSTSDGPLTGRFLVNPLIYFHCPPFFLVLASFLLSVPLLLLYYFLKGLKLDAKPIYYYNSCHTFFYLHIFSCLLNAHSRFIATDLVD